MSRNPLSSKEVFDWPELKLFCDRAGISLFPGTTSITILLEVGTCLIVKQTYSPRGNISGGENDGCNSTD